MSRKTEVEKMIDKFIEELRHPEKAFVGTHRIEGHTLLYDNCYMTTAFNAFIGFNGCYDISTCPLTESTSSNIIGITVMAEYMDKEYYDNDNDVIFNIKFAPEHDYCYNSVIFNIKFTPEQLAEIKRITGEQENATNG